MGQLDLSTRLGGVAPRTGVKDKFAPQPQIANIGEPFLIPEDTRKQDRIPAGSTRTEKPLTVGARYAYVPKDLGGGQYIIEPTTEPGETVKSIRKSNIDLDPQEKIIREMMRGGLSAGRVEIDHIIPLWLGGGDTLYNLEPLAKPDHERKNKVDAVVRTLYWGKDEKGNPLLSPKEAQSLVMNWRDKDVEGINPDEDNYGTVDLEFAKQKLAEWYNPKMPGAWDAVKAVLYHTPILGNIGEKIFGAPNKTTQQVLDAWHEGPKSDLGAGVAAFTSAATLGWSPFPEGKPEDQDAGRFGATTVGSIAGILIPYSFAAKALQKLTGLGALSANMAKGTAAVAKGAQTTAQATQAAQTLAKSYKLGEASLRFLSTPAGRFLTSTDPLLAKGLTPAIAKYMPKVTGKVIGQMVTEAGLWGMMSQLERQDEYDFGHQMELLLSSMGKGATMGAVKGKVNPMAFAGIGTSVYMIDKLSGMDDADAIADAAMMMGLHGVFTGLSKVSLPQNMKDIPLKLNTLDGIIQKRLGIEAEGARVRIAEKLGEEPMTGKLSDREMETESAKFFEKADALFAETNDPIAYKKLKEDITLYHKFLNAKGLDPYAAQQRAMDDINSLLNKAAQEKTSISDAVPEKINWWALEPVNQQYIRNGLIESIPETVTDPTNAPIGMFQGTGTAVDVSPTSTSNIRTLTQAEPGANAVRRELPAMAILREDWAGGIEAMNRERTLARTGRIYENPADNVQIVSFDPMTGQPLHVTTVPTKERIGEVTRDAERNITGVSPDASPTSINKNIETYNRTAGPERQRAYIDPDKFNNTAISSYLRQNNGAAMPVSLEIIGTSGVTSGKSYAMVKITPDHASRVITADMLPTALPEMTPAQAQTANVREQISRTDKTIKGESVYDVLAGTETTPAALEERGTSFLTGLVNNVSGRTTDARQAASTRAALGFNEAKGTYTVDGIGVSPNRLRLKDALKILKNNKDNPQAVGMYGLINQDIKYILNKANPLNRDGLLYRLANANVYSEPTPAKTGQIQQKLPLEPVGAPTQAEITQKAIASVQRETPQKQFPIVTAKTEVASTAKQVKKAITKNPAQKVSLVNKVIEQAPVEITGPKVKAKTLPEAEAIAIIYNEKSKNAGVTAVPEVEKAIPTETKPASEPDKVIEIDYKPNPKFSSRNELYLDLLAKERERKGLNLESTEERKIIEEAPRERNSTVDTIERDTALSNYAKAKKFDSVTESEMRKDNLMIWAEDSMEVRGELRNEFAEKYGFDWNDYYNQQKLTGFFGADMKGQVYADQIYKSAKESASPNKKLFWQQVIVDNNRRKPGWDMPGSYLYGSKMKNVFSERSTDKPFEAKQARSGAEKEVEKSSSLLKQMISDAVTLSNVNEARLYDKTIDNFDVVPDYIKNLVIDIRLKNPDAIIESFPTTYAGKGGKYVNIFPDINKFINKAAEMLGKEKFGTEVKIGFEGDPTKRFEALHLTEEDKVRFDKILGPESYSVSTPTDVMEARTNNTLSWALSPFSTIGEGNMSQAEVAYLARRYNNIFSTGWKIPEYNVTRAAKNPIAKDLELSSHLERMKEGIKKNGILGTIMRDMEWKKKLAAQKSAGAPLNEKIAGVKAGVEKFKKLEFGETK